MENTLTETTCPSCHTSIPAGANFCPRCGMKFTEGPEEARGKESPLSTSAGKQTFIYLFSFFLAPLGIGYAIKYLKQRNNPEARRIGIIVIMLTVIAVVLMFWISSAFTQWELGTINSLTGY